MRRMDEVKADPRVILEARRGDGGRGDGGRGWVTVHGRTMRVVFSWGGGWDHVSVSLPNRCPAWEEMCAVKSIFFRPDECCVEYHPPESRYVNIHPYCLHIWRPQEKEIQQPPIWMV